MSTGNTAILLIIAIWLIGAVGIVMIVRHMRRSCRFHGGVFSLVSVFVGTLPSILIKFGFIEKTGMTVLLAIGGFFVSFIFSWGVSNKLYREIAKRQHIKPRTTDG